MAEDLEIPTFIRDDPEVNEPVDKEMIGNPR